MFGLFSKKVDPILGPFAEAYVDHLKQRGENLPYALQFAKSHGTNTQCQHLWSLRGKTKTPGNLARVLINGTSEGFLRLAVNGLMLDTDDPAQDLAKTENMEPLEWVSAQQAADSLVDIRLLAELNRWEMPEELLKVADPAGCRFGNLELFGFSSLQRAWIEGGVYLLIGQFADSDEDPHALCLRNGAYWSCDPEWQGLKRLDYSFNELKQIALTDPDRLVA